MRNERIATSSLLLLLSMINMSDESMDAFGGRCYHAAIATIRCDGRHLHLTFIDSRLRAIDLDCARRHMLQKRREQIRGLI